MDVDVLLDARERALAFLREARNADGSWGYLARGPGASEPTLHAAAAGAGASVAWLGAADLGWGRLLVPAALARVPEAAALREAAVEHILGLAGEPVEPDPAVMGHDTTITAWPWIAGTAAWVEPTAYAVLSLRTVGRGDHPRALEGLRMLRDRQCADGGWNYGNPEVYGEALESEIVPTGWATLALPGGPEVDRALARLLDAAAHPSGLSLSLAILARVAHRAPIEALAALLVARQDADGGFGGRCERTALAACALGAAVEGTHVYAV